MTKLVLLVGAVRFEEDDCACVHDRAGAPVIVHANGQFFHFGPNRLKTIPVGSDFQLIAPENGAHQPHSTDFSEQWFLGVFSEAPEIPSLPESFLDEILVDRHFSQQLFPHVETQDCGCFTGHDCGDCGDCSDCVDCGDCSGGKGPRAEEDCGGCEGNSSPLTAWLHLTDRCNLRCSYCYLPHVPEDMTLETGKASIEATFRSALTNGFGQIKLKYAGGEPLLRFPLLVELHAYARELSLIHGIDLDGVVLSNGTLLTPEIVETLKSLQLKLMISVDGFGRYHDQHRSYASGRGSFNDVANAVDLALACGLMSSISVTISSRTVDGLPELMKWILMRDLPFSLNFYRENDLSASHEDMQLDEEKIIAGMKAAFKTIEADLPKRSLLGGILDRANLAAPHTHTCGVGQNYLVFDQNGQVAKCQMHMRQPVSNAQAADPLAVVRADMTGIQNLPVLEKEGCRDCQWRHWCAGGCPLTTFRATGRYDIQSPNCNIYKALFPEALRLEGLRLLKYQNDPRIVVKI